MMVVLYTAQDGRQVVITPAPGVTPQQAASAVPAGLSWQVVDSADVPPDPPVVDYPPLSRFQVRAVLQIAGLLDAADAVAAQADPLVKLAWDTAGTFKRTSPSINGLAPALGLTSADVDAMWLQAAQIEV